MQGKCCADNILVHVCESGKSLCESTCPLAASIDDGEIRQDRVFMRHKEGHRVPLNVTVSPIRSTSGEIIGGLETFSDATPVMAALEEAQRLKKDALICPLTGVANRRYTEENLVRRLKELEEKGTPLAVLFVDVDHFKKVNDTYGHDVGDVILKMVARTLSGAMRTYDLLGRWGGEEFVAVLPNLQPIEVQTIAERLRALVEKASRDVSKGKLKVTVSLGAYVCQKGDTPATVVAHADKLMYTSKSNGRNRVTMSPTRTPVAQEE